MGAADGERDTSVPQTRICAAEGKAGVKGICLSGGGIRSASYSLGALQAMQEHGLVTGDGPGKVDYLSAVSGGSYIASALTMVAKGPIDTADEAAAVEAAADPFARGTPEEQFVRDRTTYLLHGTGGVFAMASRLVGGILLNLLFLGLAVHSLFRFAGWFYGWVFPSLRSGLHTKAKAIAQAGHAIHHVARPAHVALHLVSWTWLGPLAVGGGLGVLIGLVALGTDWENDTTRTGLLRACWTLLGASAAVALVCAGIPCLLALVRNVIALWGYHPADQTQAAVRSTQRLTIGGGAGAAGAIVTALLALRARATDPGLRRESERWLTKKLKVLLPKLRMILLTGLAALFGPLILIAGAVASLNVGAANTVFKFGHEAWIEAVIVAASFGLFLFMRHFADLNSWSMHAIYKRRLSGTFILSRVLGKDGGVEARARDYSHTYRLSESQPAGMPKLLLCAAANVTDYGLMATGSNAVGFVFSAEDIGSPLCTMGTKEYEGVVDPLIRSVTLPTAMAIASAAISPSMGKMTKRPLCFLLALLNLRLGVWIPNPKRVKRKQEKQLKKLAKMPVDERTVQNLERLERARTRFLRPRMNYLLREMIGYHSANARFINVSDGGHYENLGLVELLRKGCTTVWCVDASGEKIDTFGTLAEAIAIARSELGVDISIDAQKMAPDPSATGAAARYVRSTWANGTIRYQNGVTGDLIVIKAGVPNDAPADVLSFHQKAARFPCDPTSNQLYTYERFDAYRALGYFSARAALAGATRSDRTLIAPPWQPEAVGQKPEVVDVRDRELMPT